MFKSKLVLIKLSVIFAAFVFFLLGLQNFTIMPETARANSSGPPPAHTNAPGENNCTECHTSFPVNSGAGNVQISPIPANYFPGQSVPLTVTVNQDDAVIYGFQLTAIDNAGKIVGTFTLPAQSPAQTQAINGIVGGQNRRYVEHTISGTDPTTFGTKSWNFTWNPPAQRVGKVRFYAAGNASNSDSTTNGDYIYTTNKSILTGTAIANFDGDGISDVSVFRPSDGNWYRLNSSNGAFAATNFGSSGDKIVPGDYDADGKTDVAVFRPSNGVWYIARSSNGAITSTTFGLNGDIPVQADYDGDGKTDIAVFRPSNGTWYIVRSSDGSFDFRQFGLGTDKPAPGDYDGDGKTDIAVFRSSNGTWYISKSSNGAFAASAFGTNGDKPVPADYDGDGKTDLAVFRGGTWYLQRTTAGFIGTQFGLSNDVPVPADYDGDGISDIAVFRGGTWYALKSSDATLFAVGFGISNDIPVPSGYLPQ